MSSSSKTVSVVLCHVCNAEPYVGTPGQVMEVPAEVAQEWIAEGGAKLVKQPKPVELPKPTPAEGEQQGEEPSTVKEPAKGKKRQGGRLPKPTPAEGEQQGEEETTNES